MASEGYVFRAASDLSVLSTHVEATSGVCVMTSSWFEAIDPLLVHMGLAVASESFMEALADDQPWPCDDQFIRAGGGES